MRRTWEAQHAHIRTVLLGLRLKIALPFRFKTASNFICGSEAIVMRLYKNHCYWPLSSLLASFMFLASRFRCSQLSVFPSSLSREEGKKGYYSNSNSKIIALANSSAQLLGANCPLASSRSPSLSLVCAGRSHSKMALPFSLSSLRR